MPTKDYKLNKHEQETIITFNAASSQANIYSTDPIWINKIKKIDGYKRHDVGYEVDVPKKFILMESK